MKMFAFCKVRHKMSLYAMGKQSSMQTFYGVKLLGHCMQCEDKNICQFEFVKI